MEVGKDTLGSVLMALNFNFSNFRAGLYTSDVAVDTI
jgi:hypothetical protein